MKYNYEMSINGGIWTCTDFNGKYAKKGDAFDEKLMILLPKGSFSYN